MLEAIRKRTTSIVVKLLFALLILSFAVWGVGDMVRTGGANTAIATIGDLELQHQEVRTEVNQEMTRLRAMFGGQLDTEQARALGVVNRVVSRMIDRALFKQGGRELGVTISDGLVRTEIESLEQFRGSAGEFSRSRFQNILRNNGLSEAGYVAIVRNTLSRNQYLETISASSTTPDSLAENIYRYRQEKRVAEALYITDASVADPGQPDDDALAKYHQQNAQRFTAPEYRKLTVVVLLIDDLAKETAVAEDKIKDAYDDQIDTFNQPERRRVQQILFADETEAKTADVKLRGGADFAQTAKDMTGSEAKDLDLGLFTKDQLLPELAEKAFSLSPDALTAPIKSPLGWHILKVTEIQPARLQTLDEVRAGLKKALARELAVDGLYSLANQLEDELGGGATLEEAAARLDLTRRTILSIDASGTNAAGSVVKDLPPGQQFLNTAFRTEEGLESPLTDLGDAGYFILRVDGVTAPALRPINTVRDEVVAAWKAKKRTEAAEKTVGELVDRIKDGEDIFTIASGLKLEVTTTAPFTRSSRNRPDKLSARLISKLFKLSTGQPAMGRSGPGYTVARLKEIQPANPAADREGFDIVKDEIRRDIANDLLAQLGAALRQRFPVSINSQAVQQLF